MRGLVMGNGRVNYRATHGSILDNARVDYRATRGSVLGNVRVDYRATHGLIIEQRATWLSGERLGLATHVDCSVFNRKCKNLL